MDTNLYQLVTNYKLQILQSLVLDQKLNLLKSRQKKKINLISEDLKLDGTANKLKFN